jgi:ubiquinone/menaquinone biosynthesis C-methylase UbiE
MSLLSYENSIDPILRDVRKIIPVFAGMKAGDTVLDVCCGTGAQVIEYSRNNIKASGIDSERSMLSIAQKNNRNMKSMQASFYLGDATSLPFRDDTFDFVSVSFGLHDKEKEARNKVVAEMKRVVKQDGALILADFHVPLPKNIFTLLVKTIERFAGGSHYQGFKNFITSDGLRTVVKDNLLFQEKTGTFKSGILEIVKTRLNQA